MDHNEVILLPGTDKQSDALISHSPFDFSSILMIGSGGAVISKRLRDHYNAGVFKIVEDENSLLIDRLALKGEKNISVKLNEFTSTDFRKDQFDLVYAQASLSDKRRSKILKEIKRVLKYGGILCTGEVTQLNDAPPPFMKNVWESSALNPMPVNDLVKYYTGRGFEVLLEKDLQFSLTEYYSVQSDLLSGRLNELDDNEKSYYKKLLNRLSHESNAYLNLGGDKHMGFRMLILKKVDS